MTSSAFREQLARRALRARVTIPQEAVEPLEVYMRLLARWNRTVNLTALSVDAPTDSTIDRLLIEPLAAAQRVADDWSPWIDIGSGGGSPAIPLKIARPRLRLTMVESKARKAAFLREALRDLRLVHTAVEALRLEELSNRLDRASVGLATIRAVRLTEELAAAVHAMLREGSHLLIFSSTPTHEPVNGFDQLPPVRLVEGSRESWLLDFVAGSGVPRGTGP